MNKRATLITVYVFTYTAYNYTKPSMLETSSRLSMPHKKKKSITKTYMSL